MQNSECKAPKQLRFFFPQRYQTLCNGFSVELGALPMYPRSNQQACMGRRWAEFLWWSSTQLPQKRIHRTILPGSTANRNSCWMYTTTVYLCWIYVGGMGFSLATQIEIRNKGVLILQADFSSQEIKGVAPQKPQPTWTHPFISCLLM
jgi:hypothetical protein